MLFTFTARYAMPIAARLDEYGKPAWILLLILGFVAWWPLGLAILAFMIGSGRMGCWTHNSMGRWQSKIERMQEKMERGGAFKRQSRLRRISGRDAAAARRGTARVQGIFAAAAFRQGPRGIRPVHGRAPQPAAGTAGHGTFVPAATELKISKPLCHRAIHPGEMDGPHLCGTGDNPGSLAPDINAPLSIVGFVRGERPV